MRIITLITALFLLAGLSHSKTLEALPTNKEYIRWVMGGGEPVTIDSHTPLGDLVERLNLDWELVFTGKSYWIGYTDDMYSIAAHGDAAIPLLLDLIKSNKSITGSYGAILTLHLIGIDGTVTGRFHEEFKNPKARAALLSLIDNDLWRTWVISLLARDPWKTDIPVLVTHLQQADFLDISVINALFRYVKTGFPFRQDISTTWERIPLHYEDLNNRFKIGELRILKQNKTVTVRNPDLIYQYSSHGAVNRSLKLEPHGKILPKELTGKEIYELLYNLFLLSQDKVSIFSFLGSDDHLWHYVENGQIIIVDAEVAKKRWLDHFKVEPSPPAERKTAPKTLTEVHEQIERLLPQNELAKIDALKDEDAIPAAMFNIRGLEESWGLWGNGPLVQQMRNLGFLYPDEMSEVILATFWCRRHRKDFQIKDRVGHYEARRKALELPPENAKDPADGSTVDWITTRDTRGGWGLIRRMYLGKSKHTGRWLAYEFDKGVYVPDAETVKDLNGSQERDPFAPGGSGGESPK